MFAWFNNLKIQNKLIATFMVIILISTVVLGWSILKLRQIDAEAQDIAREAKELIALEGVHTNLLEQELAEKDFLLTGDPAYIDLHKQFGQATDEQLQLALSFAIHQEDIEMIRAIMDERDEYEALFTQLVAAYNQGGIEEANRISVEESIVKVEQIHGQIKGIIVKGVAIVDEEAHQAEVLTQNAINSSIIGLIVATVVALSISVYLARAIAGTLARMVMAAQRISAGDLSQQVIVSSRDELGILAAAFNQMIDYLQQMAVAANGLSEGDVAVEVTPQSEKDVLGQAFRQMITYQQNMAEAAGRLAQGDVSVNVAPYSDRDQLGQAFAGMITYQQQMAAVANSLAEGDLTADVAPQSDQDSLGNAFERMVYNLAQLVGQVQQSAEQVTEASRQLNASAEQAGQAGQEVTTTIQQVAVGTAQQTQAMTEASDNVEQVARAADGIARGAQEQAQGVQSMSSLIDEMADQIDQVGQAAGSVAEANDRVSQAARHGVSVVAQTNQGMDAIRSRTTAAAEKIKEMNARSREIGRIVETIDDIADKTDMLALNAAVEAARAGEHGRGFAVVADQVRKLSEDSKGATADIADLIERVQETVSEAIAAMESTMAEVDSGMQLAGDTSHSLQEILQVAEEAVASTQQIKAAVGHLHERSVGVVTAVESVSTVVEENTAVAEEMAANSQEVTEAMAGVAGVAEQNSASAEQVSASAEELSAQVEEVIASAEELAALADELRSASARFRVRRGYGQTAGSDRHGSYYNGRESLDPTPVGRAANGQAGLAVA